MSSRSDSSHPVLVTCWQDAWWQCACVSLKWLRSCWWWTNRELSGHEMRSNRELLEGVWFNPMESRRGSSGLRPEGFREERRDKGGGLNSTSLEFISWLASESGYMSSGSIFVMDICHIVGRQPQRSSTLRLEECTEATRSSAASRWSNLKCRLALLLKHFDTNCSANWDYKVWRHSSC